MIKENGEWKCSEGVGILRGSISLRIMWEEMVRIKALISEAK
jgi:hypothetical protein